MKIMVLNCGSSSVKFQVIEIDRESRNKNDERVLARGLVERVGEDDAIISYEAEGKNPVKKVEPVRDHKDAIEKILDLLLDTATGILKNIDEIEAVGHRTVHGGEEFASSVIIDDEVLKKLRECSRLAPLHNPANLKGYEAIREVLPGVTNVAVFDTAFHQTMPPFSYLYAIPRKYYRKYQVRRFGFHGTSHRYVFSRYCELAGRDPEKTSAITCHLGNGASIAAVRNGKSLDTSMGLTPLEGLVMGTRCGDLDPAVPQFLVHQEGIDIDEFTRILNKESGMLALSGKTNDMREIIIAAAEGDKDCNLAIDIYCYRLKKYIGAYLAALDGADGIVFTGGVGEKAEIVRRKTCTKLDFLGIELDREKNKELNGKEGKISTDSSRVDIYIIPTDEELVIARDTFDCIEQKK